MKLRKEITLTLKVNVIKVITSRTIHSELIIPEISIATACTLQGLAASHLVYKEW